MMQDSDDIFASADWYDRTINWRARMERELPVLVDVFGAPGGGGLVDAGCGTGRHTIALSRLGYSMIGVDSSDEMLEVAARIAQDERIEPPPLFVLASYAGLSEEVGDHRDGLICLGNALAAAGDRQGVEAGIHAFAGCLRKGGRCLLQILNFAKMRREKPCVRGPRVARVEDREYVSFRQFQFCQDQVEVVNVTLWNEDHWRKHARAGTLYPAELPELSTWCAAAGLHIDTLWGNYARDPFDVAISDDLILVATRV